MFIWSIGFNVNNSKDFFFEKLISDVRKWYSENYHGLDDRENIHVYEIIKLYNPEDFKNKSGKSLSKARTKFLTDVQTATDLVYGKFKW